ncbi:hypothetical protein FH972_023589 [Carpinus fangiana]|uniref:aspartate kinase n=1 Tax=Carpinus fangiana TaxID=176857 RepID=A0A5N6KW03_9ROSI|nr:hypothetical protein FH972_023589 [Carpinus fangiana]
MPSSPPPLVYTPKLVPWGALAAPHKLAQKIQNTADIAPLAGVLDAAIPRGSGWIVQKFGGTSVGKFPRTIARDIVSAGLHNNRIAIVCSARSTQTKSEGTTNRLLRAAREAESRGSATFVPIIDAIRDDHKACAKATIENADIVADLSARIDEECDNLVKILTSAQHLEEVSARVEDKILSRGEKLSCLYMTALLNDNDVPAAFIDLANILRPQSANGNSSHHQAPLDEAFYKSLAHTMAEEILRSTAPSSPEARPKVPVITGYFGAIPGGLLNAVGRGYTDLCAALVAVGLEASELQIWKEVDGIFTADPRKVPTARLLPSVTPAEAAELTFYGSEVIHPFTMEQVIRARIPIRIKNVMNPRNAGTIIFPDAQSLADASFEPTTSDPRIFRTRSTAHLATLPAMLAQRPKRPTAITVKHDIIILNVHSNKRTRAHGFLMNIYFVLDKWHLSVDLIASSEVHVSMALHSEHANLISSPPQSTPAASGWEEVNIANEDLYGAVSELQQFGTIDIVSNMAIVSLVGKQLKNMVGISGKFLSTLGANNINIEMISQGASEINVSCVIDARDADRALNVVHTNLFTFLD